MFKKLAIVALLVAAGVFVLNRFDINCCRKNGTLENRIKAQRARLNSTDEEIKKNIHLVAVREVELKNLDAEIKDVRARQVDSKKFILAKRDELKAEAALVKAGDKADPARQRAEKELTRLVAAYKACEADLKAREAKRDALQQALDSAKDELDAYQDARREQEIELARLEAMLAQVRAKETKSKVHFNKSKLSEIKKGNAELRKDIEVREKELELEGRYLGQPDTAQTKEPAKDVLKEVEELFGPQQK